jgi:two-component system chemotaxis sensor kinase CheA
MADSVASSAPALGLERVLLLQGADDERMALDLSQVARLESLDPGRIERVGDNLVVQYRGTILPLIDLQRALPERRTSRRNETPSEADGTSVVICTVENRSCGLLVYRILDIVDADLSNSTAGSRKGVQECCVIDGRVNEILDLAAVIHLADPGFFTSGGAAGGSV